MERWKPQLTQVEFDLGLNVVFVKGQTVPIKNCWHFYSNGQDVDAMFLDEEDFRNGMNRVYTVSLRYCVIILAFVLMDTHFHFILYGSYEECNGFVHEYLRLTSMYISKKYTDKNKLAAVAINHQNVEDDIYLKSVICYVIKNPTAGGLPYTAYNYPWSSGPLYFAGKHSWAAASWRSLIDASYMLKELGTVDTRNTLHSKATALTNARIVDGIVFPGDYVSYDLVERIFRSTKSFQFFMSLNRDSEIESRGGCISWLSLPMQEMRQHRNEMIQEMFGPIAVKSLNTSNRIRLAKALKFKYNCSPKQIARLCGLNAEQIKDLL